MNAVYKSPDGGQHWTPYNAGLKEHISAVNQFFDLRNAEMIYAETTIGVFKTTNGGRVWEENMTRDERSAYRPKPQHRSTASTHSVC